MHRRAADRHREHLAELLERVAERCEAVIPADGDVGFPPQLPR
jgi:hypothetical protein